MNKLCISIAFILCSLSTLLAQASGSGPFTQASISGLGYVAGGGTAQAQTATLAPAIGSLAAGLTVCWLPTAANTATAPTLAVNGLTATAITKFGNVPLVPNDLVTATIACAQYDGTQFELLNPQSGGRVEWWIAGTGGVTNGLAVKEDTSNPSQAIVIGSAEQNNYLGVAQATASAGAFFPVVVLGPASCIADGTVTADHFLSGGTGTVGRYKDSNANTLTSVGQTTFILGHALASATVGQSFACWIQPGIYGMNILAVTGSYGLPTVQGTVLNMTKVDVVGSTAAQSAATLFTPGQTMRYEVCYYSKITTAATTSSILGGTTGFSLAYTDGTDSVAQTAFTLPETAQTGNTVAIGTGNTLNTTQGTLTGCAEVYMKTGVAVTYSFGYSSTGGTPMAYELHISVFPK